MKFGKLFALFRETYSKTDASHSTEKATSDKLTKFDTEKSTHTVCPGSPFAFEMSTFNASGFTIQTSPS